MSYDTNGLHIAEIAWVAMNLPEVYNEVEAALNAHQEEVAIEIAQKAIKAHEEEII